LRKSTPSIHDLLEEKASRETLGQTIRVPSSLKDLNRKLPKARYEKSSSCKKIKTEPMLEL